MAETRTKSRPRAATKAKSDEAKKQARPRRSAKSREVEEHARSYFEALAARDPKAMASHWRTDGVDDIVPVAVLRGPEEIEGFFRSVVDALPDMEATVSRVVADDRHAVVEWRTSGTFNGAPFLGVEPSGKRLELRGLDILEIEEREIVRNTAYYDGAAFARQVGMLPPQDSGAERAMKGAFNAVARLRKAVNERAGS
jgi:steroid delta-isomerase-like uncharacterized protein